MRRNVCGTAQVRPHASRAARIARAVALVPYTLGVTLGRRSENIALCAEVSGAFRQLIHEPVGKVQPPVGRFALRTAQVDASALKVDVLPPNAPGFVDPGPGSCQERNEICCRPPLASAAGFSPGSRAARVLCE